MNNFSKELPVLESEVINKKNSSLAEEEKVSLHLLAQILVQKVLETRND